ncbi:hypothetical protein V3C99_015322 [Haemonchus contortus]
MGTSAVKGGDWKGYMEHLLREKEVSEGNLQQWTERNGNRLCASKKVIPQNCKRHQDTTGEGLATQHRPLLADIAIDLPNKSRTRTERGIRWWKLHRLEREHLKGKILEVGLPDPEGLIQQTWSNAVKVILGCAKETLGETRGGTRGDKEPWFWNDEVQRVVREEIGKLIARQVMEKYREKRRPCYLAFLDMEKAFDRLPREVLWRALRKRNVPEHLISLVKDMYDGSTTTVRTAHGQTAATDVTVGVHQGSALSPFLFLLTMNVITEELVDEPLKTILYADDIALIAESKEELQDNFQKWQKVLAENGL